ncbi:hypothetical protein BV898_13583 [Hypsibius exemplaris]|uniref:Uncharacterized protein n=1 Tax=Hypsibius exemplaris TaxID=2072580 RepID=A0A1W0WAB5_HYPEX|nr:hypothetical protein BV898_13583 [Hypsibius exemplaris]
MQNRNRRGLLNRNRTADREQSKTAPPRTAARSAAVRCGLRKIVEALKVRNIVISQKAVSNLIRKNNNKEAGSNTAPSSMKPRGPPKLRTHGLVAAIVKDLSGPNLLTRSALSLKYGVSATTIANVISQDLEGKVRKKCRVHALSNKQAKQRLDRGPRFLRYINVRKWKNIVSIDEAWVYLTDTNVIRKIYYEFRGERSPESWTKFWKESHPKGVMFVAGVLLPWKNRNPFRQTRNENQQ